MDAIWDYYSHESKVYIIYTTLNIIATLEPAETIGLSCVVHGPTTEYVVVAAIQHQSLGRPKDDHSRSNNLTVVHRGSSITCILRSMWHC